MVCYMTWYVLCRGTVYDVALRGMTRYVVMAYVVFGIVLHVICNGYYYICAPFTKLSFALFIHLRD